MISVGVGCLVLVDLEQQLDHDYACDATEVAALTDRHGGLEQWGENVTLRGPRERRGIRDLGLPRWPNSWPRRPVATKSR